MAEEEPIVNGVVSDRDDVTAIKVEKEKDDSQAVLVSELSQKMELLEEEKSVLISENKATLEKIKSLTDEIEELKANQANTSEKFVEMVNKIHQSEADKKALEAIAARAGVLEAELARLQHDHISVVSEKDETIAELKSVVEVLKESNQANQMTIEELETEKANLIRDAEDVKKGKADSDILVGDMEKKLSEVEAGLGRISEKDIEIVSLQKEKNEAESVRLAVEKVLKQSDLKFEEMEKKLSELQIELEEKKKLVQEKLTMNGGAEKCESGGDCGLKSFKQNWPIVLASTGTVAVAAASVYCFYARKRLHN